MFYGLSTTIKRKRIDEFEGGNGNSASGGASTTEQGTVNGGDATQPVNLGAAQATENTPKSGCC
jgi:hypothetical protein